MGRPPRATLFPYTTLFRSELVREPRLFALVRDAGTSAMVALLSAAEPARRSASLGKTPVALPAGNATDRKSRRLNSSHGYSSYAVFCLKNKTPRRGRGARR